MEEQKPAKGRGWKVLLVVSLALNLLFVGLIGGAMARFGGAGPHGGHEGARGGSLGTAVFRALPREDRRAMFRLMFSERSKKPEESSGARSEEAMELLANLRADQFDSDLLLQFAEQQADKRLSRRQQVAEAWVERVNAMSIEERRAYADRLEEILNNRGKKRHWGKRKSE